MRDCPTYGYWQDLKSDLRRPDSWLDLANMALRRVRLVLVKTVRDDGRAAWRVERWTSFLDRTHQQGRCTVCRSP